MNSDFKVLLDKLKERSRMDEKSIALEAKTQDSVDYTKQSSFFNGYVRCQNDTDPLINLQFEIIAELVDTLEEIVAEGHTTNCQVMKPVRPTYACSADYAESALQSAENKIEKFLKGGE